jgi:arsenate reductase
MAEGYMRAHYGDRYDVFSAGTEPTAIDPIAIAVMTETGIDISQGRAKPVAEFSGKPVDTVVHKAIDYTFPVI